MTQRSPTRSRSWCLGCAALVVAGCATEGNLRPQLDGLRQELRALHAENERLAERLDRLERRTAVAAPQRAESAEAPAPASSSTELPDLTVVRLKPRGERAPALETAVAVVEPSQDILDALASKVARPEPSASASASASAKDDKDAEALFGRGLDALRTGNVSGGVEMLERFAAEHPRHGSADNALYFSGVGRMGLEDYEGAWGTFDRLISTYPAGDAVADAAKKRDACRMRLRRAARGAAN